MYPLLVEVNAGELGSFKAYVKDKNQIEREREYEKQEQEQKSKKR